MTQVPLGDGQFAQIDNCDIDLLWNHSWCFGGQHRYPYSFFKGKTIYLHKEVGKRLNLSRVEHRDRNPLDCTRSNLRESTQAQNTRNRGPQRNNILGIKGVRWHKRLQKYQAAITINGKKIHLITTDSLEKATVAYDKAAREHHQEFAFQNEGA